MQIAALFRITGRKNEVGYQQDPTLYDTYKQNSVNNFETYILETNNELNLSDDNIKYCKELIFNMGDPNKADKNLDNLIIYLAIQLDLYRCNQPKVINNILNIIKNKLENICDVSSDNSIYNTASNALLRIPLYFIEATGDALSSAWEEEKVISQTKWYEPERFIKTSTDVNYSMKVINDTALQVYYQDEKIKQLQNNLIKNLKNKTLEFYNNASYSFNTLFELSAGLNDNLQNNKSVENFSKVIREITYYYHHSAISIRNCLGWDFELKSHTNNSNFILETGLTNQNLEYYLENFSSTDEMEEAFENKPYKMPALIRVKSSSGYNYFTYSRNSDNTVTLKSLNSRDETLWDPIFANNKKYQIIKSDLDKSSVISVIKSSNAMHHRLEVSNLEIKLEEFNAFYIKLDELFNEKIFYNLIKNIILFKKYYFMLSEEEKTKLFEKGKFDQKWINQILFSPLQKLSRLQLEIENFLKTLLEYSQDLDSLIENDQNKEKIQALKNQVKNNIDLLQSISAKLKTINVMFDRFIFIAEKSDIDNILVDKFVDDIKSHQISPYLELTYFNDPILHPYFTVEKNEQDQKISISYFIEKDKAFSDGKMAFFNLFILEKNQEKFIQTEKDRYILTISYKDFSKLFHAVQGFFDKIYSEIHYDDQFTKKFFNNDWENYSRYLDAIDNQHCVAKKY